MVADDTRDLRAVLETRMGELASLLTEVAEALTGYPGELVIVDGVTGEQVQGDAIFVNAREWPSIQEIEQLLANWRTLSALPSGESPRRAIGR